MLTKVQVLKEFSYSANGISVTVVKPPEVLEINENLVAGLEAEGFIKRAAISFAVAPPPTMTATTTIATVAVAEPDAMAFVPLPINIDPTIVSATEVEPPQAELAVAEIPAEWRSLKWFSLKALAKTVSGKDPKDGKEAAALIEAELAARAARAPSPKQE